MKRNPNTALLSEGMFTEKPRLVVCERLCTSVNVCERDVFFQLFHDKLPLELTDRSAPSIRRAKAGPWDWPDCSALYCSREGLKIS